MDNAIRRIKKAIALAERNPNQGESEAAWNRVHHMLHEYDLTLEEVYKGKRIRKIRGNVTHLLDGTVEKVKRQSTRLSWHDFFRVESDTPVALQITPDPTVQSGKNVESMLNLFHSMYEGVMDRLWYEGKTIVYKTKDSVSYRIVFEDGRITFYLIVPSQYVNAVQNSIRNAWPKTAVNEVDMDVRLDPKHTVGGYIELRDHYFKSTLVDRNKPEPLPSLIAAGRNVIEDDVAILDMMFVPVNKRWQQHAKVAYEKHRKGQDVNKRPNSLVDVAFVVGDFISDVLIEKAFGFLDSAFGVEQNGKKFDPWEMAMRKLNPATNQKGQHHGFDTVIRVLSQSQHRPRAEMTMSSIATAFRDLTLDNELQLHRVKANQRFIDNVMKHKQPLLRINGNIMSVPECSQIYQLPNATLQEEYPEIERIPQLEVEAHPLLLQKGMYLGDVVYKKHAQHIYQPTKNYDELCLPNIVLGGMGMGKTTMLSNWAVEAYLNGFGALTIDAAKREIGDEIESLVDKGIIPRDDFIRFDLGDTPMSLDWYEATLHSNGLSRLASIIIDFFNIENDTTGQTGRFLRAIVKSMRTGKLIEIIEILENEERIDEVLSSLKPGTLTYATMEQYKRASAERRKQIVSPIYNRLDMILGDDYLAECMESDFTLNMIDLMSKPRIVVFDLPDDDLMKSQKDILVNLLFFKIDLAMRMREKVNGSKALFPFFIEMDEPHSYLKSAKIWASALVESRKHRVGYMMGIHYWNQLPKEVQQSIKNALTHYHIYATSKEMWKIIEDEIKPFAVDDGMRLKAHYAINVIRAGGEYLPPVIAKMAAPPHIRFGSRK